MSVIGKNYFTRMDKAVWTSSVAVLFASHFIFETSDSFYLAASLIGVTSLIFCAKGNPIGQALMLVFSALYGYISYTFHYYGEVITYVFMTAPMAAFALFSWLSHPFCGKISEVEVSSIKGAELVRLSVMTAAVTAIFYFILGYFGTANLIPSTISVTTSFAAAYLTYRRSPFWPFVYALNDIVLIILWALASLEDPSYISILICFCVFLTNDLYSFISWRALEKRQHRTLSRNENFGK